MKKAIFALIFILIFGNLQNANAADVTIDGFSNITYEDTVKLKATGCQNIKFSYFTDDALARENTVFLVQLVHKSKKIVYGGAAWFSTFTSMGPDALPSMSRIGTLSMKVCRSAWALGKGVNKQKYPAVTPGTYRLYFAGGFVDPESGAKTGDKIEVYKKLKLI